MYSFRQAKDWLEKPGSKLDISRSIVIFGRMDPDPNGRDRLPVCAEIKEEKRKKETRIEFYLLIDLLTP